MQNPPGTTGHGWLIKASPRMARPDAAACPTHQRIAMRPLLVADPPVPFRPAPREEFPFGPLFTALDLWEHSAWPLERIREELRGTRGAFRGWGAPVHPALLAWTARALERYAAARLREQRVAHAAGLPPTVPVKQSWTLRTHRADVPDPRGVRQYEHTIWGRMYASADGSVRDLWIPSLGRAKRADPRRNSRPWPRSWPTGRPHPGARRAPSPHPPRPMAGTCPIWSVSSTSGVPTASSSGCSPKVRLRRSSGSRTMGRLPSAPRRQELSTRPGESCVECKAIAGCTDLKRTPELWGGKPQTVARSRRSVSAWDLRLHGECPAQYHLVRQLHLNDLSAEGQGAQRGRAVDTLLNERHDERPARGCRERPSLDITGIRAKTGLDDASAREAAGMLGEHRLLCPLNGLAPDEQVLVQHRVTAYVPELDVVVLAVPDLVYTHHGRWIWRETKTAARPLWEGRSLLRSYPQLALGVLLFHAGALGNDPRRSWVELEHLREGHGESRLERLDPGRAENVDEARAVIAELAQPLLDDTTYEPRTGRHCHGCQARTWCRPGTAYVTDHPRPGVPGTGTTDRGDTHG
ncbi:PD-(D/E)XK nuclease family protein [Streptomyces sp. S1D4-11]